MTAVDGADDTGALALALGDTHGYARAWRCVQLARHRQDARRLIRKRVWQDWFAVWHFLLRAHARARLTTLVGAAVVAAPVVWLSFLVSVHVTPLLAWVPVVAAEAVSAPLRWRVKAVFKRQCRYSAKAQRTMAFTGTIHTADYRDHSAISGDGQGAAAQRQVVERHRYTFVPSLKHVRRTPTGWTGTVRMPPGMTADYLNEWSATVAAGWVHRIHVEPDHDDVGQGEFAIVRRDVLRGDPVPHPALHGRTDAWAPWPVGVDENGVEVAFDLAYEAMLSTGLPNTGKSVALTNAMLHAAFDPSVPLFIYDPAGDLRPLALCVDASGGSVEPGEGDTTRGMYRSGSDAAEALEVMVAVEAEIERRHDRLKGLGLAEFTRKINRGQLPVAVWSMEEWQTVRSRCSKAQRFMFDEAHGRIMLQHRKVAVVPLTTTQDPNHLVVPVPVRNEYGIRLAHHTADAITSDVALGHGMAEKGWDASNIGKHRPGVCYAQEGGGTPTVLRSYYVPDDELVAAAKRAAALRREYHASRPRSRREPTSDPRVAAEPGQGEGCGVGSGGSGVPGESSRGFVGGQGSGVGGGRVFVVSGDGSVDGSGGVGGSVGAGGSGSGGGVADADAGSGGGRRPGGAAGRVRRAGGR